LKCDKNSPCANCTKIARPCIFIASGLDADAQRKLAEVKEKMGVLERSLEEDVVRLSNKSGESSDRKRVIRLPGQEESYSDQEEDEDTKDLNQSDFISEDAVYYEGDADDDIVDLGIAMGKVRITDRIGGLVRPRFADEVSILMSITCLLLTNVPPDGFSTSRTASKRASKTQSGAKAGSTNMAGAQP
jgi:hypothetical protein